MGYSFYWILKEVYMSNWLFPEKEVKTLEQIADKEFTKSYKGMTQEIDRVASEEVTIWGALATWIYEKIFNNPFKLKEKQNEKEKLISADAFQKVEKIFSKEPNDSMTNSQIMEHTEKKFRPLIIIYLQSILRFQVN